jgi:hypothetical protein
MEEEKGSPFRKGRIQQNEKTNNIPVKDNHAEAKRQLELARQK